MPSAFTLDEINFSILRRNYFLRYAGCVALGRSLKSKFLRTINILEQKQALLDLERQCISLINKTNKYQSNIDCRSMTVVFFLIEHLLLLQSNTCFLH